MVQISNDQHLWSTVSNPKGQGTPLLMVHGMGGGVGLWSMNLDALSENRPVYAFDLLGFGRSSRPRFSSDPVEAENMFVNSIEAYREKVSVLILSLTSESNVFIFHLSHKILTIYFLFPP